MAFFRAHEMHLEPVENRERAVASLLVLGGHGMVALLLLLGLVQQVVAPPRKPPLVMTELSGNPTALVSAAPSVPSLLRVAPVSVMPPEFSIQPEASTPVVPAPTPVSTPATSTLASAMAMAPSGGTRSGTAAMASGKEAAGGASGSYNLNPYLARVAAHIQRYLRFPMALVTDRRKTGPVLVHLIFRRDGTVELAEVARSSGVLRFDDAAVAAVLRARPLPPFPAEFQGERINGVIPVEFTIN